MSAVLLNSTAAKVSDEDETKLKKQICTYYGQGACVLHAERRFLGAQAGNSPDYL